MLENHDDCKAYFFILLHYVTRRTLIFKNQKKVKL